MPTFDGEAFGREIVDIVKIYMAREFELKMAPLLDRIKILEARQPEKGDQGEPGRDGKDGIDGKDGAPGPAGKDGRDGKDGAAGANGIDGAPGEKGEKGDTGPSGKDGRDGIDGKDGAPGLNGKDGAAGVDGRDGKDGLTGRDGLAGRDGKDGLGIDDVVETIEDSGRILVRSYMRNGDVIKQFRHLTAMIIDRGFWEKRQYLKGDCVTENGSMWIAERDTDKKPREQNSGWRLSVKKGRDAKVTEWPSSE